MRWPSRMAFVPFPLLLAATPMAAQGPRPQPARALVIENVSVVDVEAGIVRAGQRIVVRGDSIASVEPIAHTAPTNVSRTIDGTGLFVIPGLVDHHVHLGAGMEAMLERAVRGGVTMVQALAGDNRIAGYLAVAVRSGRVKGPEIAYASVMAGPGFFTDPRFIGAGDGYMPGTAPWAQAVTAETDLAIAVAAARGSGAEVLKLYAMMDADLVTRLTREAHRQGMRVVAHGTVFPARPAELVVGGVDILTHAGYLVWQGATTLVEKDAWTRRYGPYSEVSVDRAPITEVLEAMVRHNTWLEPTLAIMHLNASDSIAQRWTHAVVGAAHAAGVRILAGTDGLIDGDATALPNIHREMSLLVQAGLSPAAALTSATINPARAMGRGATHGLVAAGRVADLVLLEGNPLVDIAHTTRIRSVVRRGEILP